MNLQYTMNSRKFKNYQTFDHTLLSMSVLLGGGGVGVYVECEGEWERETFKQSYL